ncbi:nucleoredoxin-like isoform X3 [Physeter macrocephalus]|uniref:Nucleoredoxin-like isoform X3 n=1 Tax=Physeter macrocephalus TaxID=9755 RepID=A0A9W2X601_PHYMC|nr:nucleoredoxin-like isoform X3 [Physeter catodon]
MSGFLEELLGEKLVTGGGEEVDVHSLAARGISLLGLYFGCSLSAPCAQLSVSLAAFYGRLRGDAAAGPGAGAGPGPGAGAAAEPESRRRLEIVFVSSDQDQRQWQDFVRDMPWLALPYKEKHRKGARVQSLVRELDPTCIPQLRVHMPQLRSPRAATKEPWSCN